NLQAAGNVTSASIDGIPATLNSGAHTRTVIVTRTGALTSTATAVGPGGTSTRTARYFVNPTCEIRPTTPPTALPGNLGLSVDIIGDYSVAIIESPAIAATKTMSGGPGVSNYPVTVKMVSSPAPIIMTVY